MKCSVVTDENYGFDFTNLQNSTVSSKILNSLKYHGRRKANEEVSPKKKVHKILWIERGLTDE